MKGWGLKVQVGRLVISPHLDHPALWFEHRSSSLDPDRIWGFGFWITRTEDLS